MLMSGRGHVNNVQYVRYAETGRCNWARNFGTYFDVVHKREWEEILSSSNVGLILRSITVDYKFVSPGIEFQLNLFEPKQLMVSHFASLLTAFPMAAHDMARPHLGLP